MLELLELLKRGDVVHAPSAFSWQSLAIVGCCPVSLNHNDRKSSCSVAAAGLFELDPESCLRNLLLPFVAEVIALKSVAGSVVDCASVIDNELEESAD